MTLRLSLRWSIPLLCGIAMFSPMASAKEITIEEEDVLLPSPKYFTRERQQRLTPAEILDELKQRNRDFVNESLTVRNTSLRIMKAAAGQYPGAVILSCLDSRVPVEDVFHSGIGDLFVARVAGNTANPEILGSLEYACKVAGAKVIIVLGHHRCGAVRSAIDGVEIGNITATLAPIRAIVGNVPGYDGTRTSANSDFVEAVSRENVLNTVRTIRSQSPILKTMEDEKGLLIVGAEYQLETGKVVFFEEK